MWLRLFVLFGIGAVSLAQTGLDAVAASVIGMRGASESAGGPRGAIPQLTTAKHLLRDWAEAQLKDVGGQADAGEAAKRLNAELRKAGLFCGENANPGSPCPEWLQLGYLEPVSVRWSGRFLVLQTGVGIECGYDESAYVYSLTDEGWRRVWQTEQNNYQEKKYKPQRIQAVLISPYSETNDYFVLTLGTETWCQSNWHDVYYRVFRLGGQLDAQPLVAGSEWAFLAEYPPIQGSISEHEALIEYRGSSIDGGVHNRSMVWHYQWATGKLTRTDPVALSPRDFVDEWLRRDWSESAFWAESANRGPMLDWYKKLHGDEVNGEFRYPTMNCPATPDLWEVGVDFAQGQSTVPPKYVYFSVRWRPPYRFSMVNISDRPSPACKAPDPAADEDRRLIPLQQ